MPLAEHFDHFLIDLDGVVYLGAEAIPGSVDAVLELRRRGKLVRFITNDPRPDHVLGRLADVLRWPAEPGIISR